MHRILVGLLVVASLLLSPVRALARCYYENGMCQSVEVEFVDCSYNKSLTEDFKIEYDKKVAQYREFNEPTTYINNFFDLQRYPARLDSIVDIKSVRKAPCSNDVATNQKSSESDPIVKDPSAYGIKKVSLKSKGPDLCPTKGTRATLQLDLHCCDTGSGFQCDYYATAQLLPK